MAAMITGAIGITVANPTDVVKVRLQNQGNPLFKDQIKTFYKGTTDCYVKIIRKEGVSALWTSWSANVVRNSVINAAEIASYDQYKQMLTHSGLMEEGTPCYLACAFGAGMTAAVFGSPFDVITTRHMNSPGVYKSPVDCAIQMVRSDGLGVLYKGFVPNVCRLGSFNICLWLTFE